MEQWNQFFLYSGIALWVLILATILVRLVFGENWVKKLGITFFLGPGLKHSLRKLAQEYPKNIQKETVADVVTHVFWRLTRLGIVGILIAGLPIWLLMQQNSLLRTQNKLFSLQDTLIMQQNQKIDSQLVMFSHQNKRIDQQTELLNTQTGLFADQNDLITDQNRKIDVQTGLFKEQNLLFTKQNAKIDTQNYRLNLQNNLIEADRRSSLVFLMSNILDKVDEEIRGQRDSIRRKLGVVPDSTRFALSKPLTSRIVALSRAFRSYRMLQGDSLSKPVSPERGQLFIALMGSKLDSFTQNTIVNQGDFIDAIVEYIDLSEANLESANLRGAYFSLAKFNYANLIEADLKYSYLGDTEFIGAKLIAADLQHADLSRANLSKASLVGANFGYAYLHQTYLKDAILSFANFEGVRKMTFNQLREARILFECKNLDPELEKQLREAKPCLFTFQGCPIE